MLSTFFKKVASFALKTREPRTALHIKTTPRLHSGLFRKEINDWQAARAAYDDPLRHETSLLQELYTDVLLDAHLSAVMQSRVLKTSGKRFVIRNAKGFIDDKKTRYIQKPWFGHLVVYALESLFYGYSLVWLSAFDDDGIARIELVPRGHVLPRTHTISKDTFPTKKGLEYENYPYHLLYVQLGYEKGLLEKAAPMTILKRHSWAHWDEFEQLFGVPLRIARVPSLETKEIPVLESWLKEMGSASYAIFPTTADIEIKEANRNDAHEVFHEKIKALNAELSKLVLGQTMTTEGGSSRSQAQVHGLTEASVLQADKEALLSWLNSTLLPAMRYHDYALEPGDKIDIHEPVSVEQKIAIDKILLGAGVALDEDYLERIYDVKIRR